MGYRSIDALGRWLQIALFACAGAHLLGAAALPGNLEQLKYAREAEQATGQEVIVYATPQGGGLAFEIFTWVVVAVVFLCFFRRAYLNLSALAPAYQRWDNGWALAAWFIPVINWFRPKQMTNDIWRAGHGTEPPALLGWWWGCFLAAYLVTGVAWFSPDPTGMTTTEVLFATVAMAAGEILIAVASILAAVVVRRLAAGQTQVGAHYLDSQKRAFFASPEAPQAS